MRETTEHGGDFVRDLGDAVRKNPISSALIGMGVVWLFASRRQITNPMERVGAVADAAQDVWRGAASNLKAGSENAQSRVSEVATALRERSSALVEDVSEKGGEFAKSASGYAGSLPEMAGGLIGDARANMAEVFRSQPLALGAVGLAIGAAIAASLPVTETEAEYLGETSDFVKETASEMATAKAHDTMDLGGKVLDAVADEARQQGLTPQDLKSTASEIAEKTSRVACAFERPSVR
jgi:hypothetical protein